MKLIKKQQIEIIKYLRVIICKQSNNLLIFNTLNLEGSKAVNTLKAKTKIWDCIDQCPSLQTQRQVDTANLRKRELAIVDNGLIGEM